VRGSRYGKCWACTQGKKKEQQKKEREREVDGSWNALLSYIINPALV
jgi:hypothetical protein